MIRRLYLEDFRVFAGQEFRFDEGITCIVGPNGSGKTTILEAIEFALFKRVRRKDKDIGKLEELIRHGRRRARVEMEFIAPANGRRYLVKRTINVGSTDAELIDVETGETIEDTVNRVNNEIVRLLGTDRDGFAALTYVRQGDINILSRLPPRKKRLTLRDMMGLGIYDDTMKNLKSKTRLLEKKLSLISQTRQTLEEVRKHLPSDTDLDKALQAIETLRGQGTNDAALEVLKTLIEQIRHSVRTVETKLASEELSVQPRLIEKEKTLAARLQTVLDEIPKVAEEQLKPRIRAEARGIFLNIFGDKYSDLAIDDDYDIRLFDVRGHPVKLSKASGGEDVCVNFALRVAVNTALQKEAQAGNTEMLQPLGLLILDEPGAGLDSQRRRWLPEAISSLDSVKQVIVVTHMEELRDAGNVVITLKPQGYDRPPRVIVQE
ncbi:MAG: AAA family ATPase [Candidatus Thorarchaeota archaeon]